MSESRVVCGVDGAPGGWAIVRGQLAPASARAPDARSFTNLVASFRADLADLVTEFRDGAVAAIAIDMPIGLVDHQPRAADVAARRLLGPRKSSVFPTPVRATLEAVDYGHACDVSRSVSGKALSKQAYNLLPKIRELDQLLVSADQNGIVESHPELAFVRLGDAHLNEPKRTAAGQLLRRTLLTRMLDAKVVSSIVESGVAPALDLIDALANLSTASHVAAGNERRLGTEIDPTGKQAEIVW